MLTLLSCARVTKSYVYPYRSKLHFEMHMIFCYFVTPIYDCDDCDNSVFIAKVKETEKLHPIKARAGH